MTTENTDDVKVQAPWVEGEKGLRDLRVREQCYLVRNLNRYARSRLLGYEQKLMPDGKSDSTSGQSSKYKTSGGGLAQVFKNLVATNADPGLVVSSLAGTLDSAALLNIPSNVLSRLVPHIQLFKVYYDVDQGTAKNSSYLSGKGTAIALPFSDSYSPTLPEDILKNKAGQGDGIGLKSLNVKFNGTNPAEVKTVLEVDMKIFVRDFVELIKVRNTKKSKSGQFHTAAFSDLITRNPNEAFETSRVFKEETFRMRAVLGWAVPEKSTIFEGVPNAKMIKNTLINTRMILTLSLAGHTINFNQDGSMVLDCKYIARFESEMRSSDKSIFAYSKKKTTAWNSKVKEAQRALRAAKLAEKKESNFDAVAGFFGFGERDLHNPDTHEKTGEQEWGWGMASKQEVLDDAEKNYEKAVANARQITTQEMGTAYKSFLSGFFKEKKHSLFWAKIPPGVYRQSIDPRVPKPEYGGVSVLVERMGPGVQNPGAEDNMTSAGAGTMTNEEVQVFQLHGYDQEGEVWASDTGGGGQGGKMQKALDDAFELLNDPDGNGYQDAMNNLNKNLSNIGDERYDYAPGEDEMAAPVPDGENYNLYFTFLGDLLDYAMNTIKDEQVSASAENLKIILGAFTYIDPLTYETRRVNISDIPIGISSFLNWMFEKYVRRERLEVSPFLFMKDMVQDLGIKYLGGTCFAPGATPVTRTKFGMQMALTVPRVNGQSTLIEGTTLQNSQLKKIALLKQNPAAHLLPPEQMDHVCYVFVTNMMPTDKAGHETVDAGRGIFHFRLGADRGVLKQAKYKRLDTPYLQEARIIENDKIDDTKQDPETRSSISTLRLKEVYNCDITMFGNTVFYPGMVFYIDPSKMGFESAGTAGRVKMLNMTTAAGATTEPAGPHRYKQTLAESLGIKGYYHVNKVEHIYESGKYETLLEGVFLTDGNADFYKDKTDSQMGRISNMLGILSDPASAAGQAFIKNMMVNGPAEGSDENLQTSAEELQETVNEINDNV
jgi:hypothetical protein